MRCPQQDDLEGVRVLAIEQMQALPYATQLFAQMGADVVQDLSRSPESSVALHCRR